VYLFTADELRIAVDGFTGGPGDGAKIGLYLNDVTPTPSSVVDDFNIDTIGGATQPKAITWAPAFINDNLQGEARGGLINWLTANDTGLPVTAFGYIIVDTTGAVLLLAERFAVPYTFNRIGQTFSLVPRVVFSN